jgi:hypothetical protein
MRARRTIEWRELGWLRAARPSSVERHFRMVRLRSPSGFSPASPASSAWTRSVVLSFRDPVSLHVMMTHMPTINANGDTVDRFVADLSGAVIGTTVNPYACYDPALDRPDGAAIRLANLRRHLQDRRRPLILLVGEAPSYRGCRFSGIAFTSERRLLPPYGWSSTLPQGWTEPSATIVHRVLTTLDIESQTMLWNVVPTR